MNNLLPPQAVVYTDGSCHTQLRMGAWVAIVFVGHSKIVLSGTQTDTSHNRMELTAVIEAITYIKSQPVEINSIDIYTDSQYVAGLPGREKKLAVNGFEGSNSGEMTNASLVKDFYNCLQKLTINFIKVKAHQKKTESANYNIEADLLCRKMVREVVGKIIL